MIFALGLIWLGVVAFSGLVFRQKGAVGLSAASRDASTTFKPLIIRLPCALLAAAFLVQIVPENVVSNVIGRDSGLWGIVIATVMGGLLPGGPMVTFPITAVLQQAGAGFPQLLALITGWSLFAISRLLTYEAPIMGWRFAILRNLSCLALPVLAGLGAELILND